MVKRLAKDLRREFPDMTGFSEGNVRRMRAFYLTWPAAIPAQAARELADRVIPAQAARELAPTGEVPATRSLDDEALPTTVSNIPWGHNIVLMEKLDDRDTRLWYAQKAIEHGWSRNILAMQIESRLHQRQGKAITNFHRTLPPEMSDLAQQTLKDPYNFDFMTIADGARELDVEHNLLDHITKLLLELGAGFAFVGRQYRLEVDGDEYFLDLLFYHTRLHCYVVIDLKIGKFLPEHAGKMNFYLTAVDELIRGDGDQPSIGLILCREKKGLSVEYALRDIAKPIGVSGWQTKITESLPKHLRGSLPTIQQIEAELQILTQGAAIPAKARVVRAKKVRRKVRRRTS